jgi:hypothetical protein
MPIARPNPNFITGTAKAVIMTQLVDDQAILAKTIHRDYARELGLGDNPTLSIKIPGRGQVVRGKVLHEDFAQQTNTVISATLEKSTIPVEIAEMDASTTVESFRDEVASPLKENFSTDINREVYRAILSGVDDAIVCETPGSADFKDLSLAIAKVIKSKVSGKRWGALDPAIMSQVRTSGQNLFNGGTVVNDLYSSFDIASYGNTEFIGTPDVETVTYPASFPSAIAGTVSNGSKQIPIATALAADMPMGVLFTIDGVNKVDAEGYALVGTPKVFVTDFTPKGSMFINIKSPIIFTPDTAAGGTLLTQVKNVSALPAANAALTLEGTAGVTYLTGAVYSELYNGDILMSLSRLDKQFPLMGMGGTAYYVAMA